MLNKSFTAQIVKSPNPGGWTYVVWPESAEFFGARGLVKVRGTVWMAGRFGARLWPWADGRHKLPLKAEILKDQKSPGSDSQRHTAGKNLDRPQEQSEK